MVLVLIKVPRLLMWNLIVRQVGLICGIVALDVMSTFVLMVYPDVIANAAGDNFTGIIKIIGFIIVYVMINLSLVNVCMQLINVVPDNIMDWIGGRISGSLGKGGEDMVGGAAKSSLAGSSWTPRKPGDKGKKDAVTPKKEESLIKLE